MSQHLVERELRQRLPIVRKLTDEKLVEEHAERVDVAAGVDLRTVKASLLGTYLGRRPEDVPGLRVKRMLGQITLEASCDAEVDDLGTRIPFGVGDEDV